MNTTWRSRNQSEEIQNAHWLNRSMSLNRKDDNNWKPINGQIKLSERIHLCRRLEMKDHLHQESYARSCREIEESKRCCYQEGNSKKKKKTTKIGRNSHAAWSGITNSESILLRSWFTEQLWRTYVPHQALITSSSRKPSREVGMPRNTRENMSIPRKRFWLSTCSTRSWRITQWFKKFGNTIGNRWCRGFWEKKELRIVGAKNHCNQYFYLAFQ